VSRDRPGGLILQVWVSHVVHQRRIERRCVHGAGNTASEDDGSLGWIIHEDYALGQLAFDQNRGVGGNPARSRDEIVEAVVQKQRVRRIRGETFGDFFGIYRPVITGMTRAARATVAAKGLVVEQLLSLTDFSCRNGYRLQRSSIHREAFRGEAGNHG